MTGFIFNVIGTAGAQRLAKEGIRWEGKTRSVLVLLKNETLKRKLNEVKKTLVQKKREEFKGKEQPRKASFSFVICYNCRGTGHTMKSCTSESKVVSKMIERKAESVDMGKKKVKIIDENGFTKVVNSQRTPSPTPGPVTQSPVLKLRIMKLKSDWDDPGEVKTRRLIEKAEQDEWKVKGPFTGPSQW